MLPKVSPQKRFGKGSVLVTALVILLALSVALSPTSQAALGDKNLSKGARGSDVTELQKKLTQAGYGLTADGIFGNKTLEKVKAFQKARGLKIDGIVGPQTVAALKKATQSNTTSSGTNIGTSNSDLDLLARCVYAESRGEPYLGQVAVAAVVLNRIKSSQFPNTISGIIYQPQAFSSVADGQINKTPDEQAKRAAKEAISGNDPTQGCVFFFNPSKTSNAFMHSRPRVISIGKHVFTR